jgi:phage shock protein E
VKTIGIIIALIMIVGLGYIVISKPGAAESEQPFSEGKFESAFVTIQREIKRGGMLLDVRTVEEFNAGHIDGATSFPVENITAGSMPYVAKDTKIYVYCRSGSRSEAAKAALEQAGYNNVVDLGAMTSVQAAGGKVVR